MITTLKILMLEDNKNDMELIKAELISSLKFELEFKWVIQKDEFADALINFNPDIILSDFSLPQFTGYHALKMAIDENPYIPFIIVTGAMSEEIAADSIKKGAWDYVVKGRLNRLPIAVENCIKLRNEKFRTKQAEDELKFVKKRLGIEIKLLYDAIDRIPDSFVITDINGTIQYVNSGFTKMTGFSAEDAIGKKPSIVKSGFHDNNFYKEIWNTITEGKEWKGDVFNKRKDGIIYRETMSIAPITDEKGRILYFVAIKYDTSAKAIFEQELIDAKVRAEESNNLKAAFLKNISHEIRTPMNSILGFSELLEDKNLTPENILRYAEIINIAGKNMMLKISDIIQISEIETNQVTISKGKIDLNQLLNSIYNQFDSSFNKKNIEFVKICPENENNIIVNIDNQKLSEIIIKLVDNALKFTQKGKVEFGYILKSENEIEFFVKDTGIGIIPENAKYIYDNFRQFNQPNDSLKQGIGLGLSIAKNYVEILGGKIEFESEIDLGTKFKVTIPCEIEILSKKTQMNQEIISKNIKILIAEDEGDAIEYLDAVLKDTNIKIVWAKNGQIAIDLFKKENDFNLVLMDIRMPEKDGLKALVEIRLIDKKIPIIIQTAFSDEIKLAMSIGATDFILKPVNANKLKQLILMYVNK